MPPLPPLPPILTLLDRASVAPLNDQLPKSTHCECVTCVMTSLRVCHVRDDVRGGGASDWLVGILPRWICNKRATTRHWTTIVAHETFDVTVSSGQTARNSPRHAIGDDIVNLATRRDWKFTGRSIAQFQKVVVAFTGKCGGQFSR